MSELILDRGINKGRCKSCQAEIVWCYTTAGRKAPFQMDDAGEWVLENGVARHVGPPPAQLELGAGPQPQRYTSHFADCAQADSWRGKK